MTVGTVAMSVGFVFHISVFHFYKRQEHKYECIVQNRLPFSFPNVIFIWKTSICWLYQHLLLGEDIDTE